MWMSGSIMHGHNIITVKRLLYVLRNTSTGHKLSSKHTHHINEFLKILILESLEPIKSQKPF